MARPWRQWLVTLCTSLRSAALQRTTTCPSRPAHGAVCSQLKTYGCGLLPDVCGVLGLAEALNAWQQWQAMHT